VCYETIGHTELVREFMLGKGDIGTPSSDLGAETLAEMVGSS